MCDIGRNGTLHAWQEENVVTNIQVVAKGLGGGYAQIAAMLVSNEIFDVVKTGEEE